MRASDVMSAGAITVRPDTSVPEVAAVLVEHAVSAVPVVGEDGALLGIVSESDLLRRPEIGTDGSRKRRWLAVFSSEDDEARDYLKSHGRTAQEVMTSPAITVSPGMPLDEVVRLMERTRVKRLPVVDGGRVVGMLSRADIVRAMVVGGPPQASSAPEDDRAIREAIIKAIKAERWARSALVNVIVSDGTVHLWGVVDDEDQRRALHVLVRGTAGVDKVEDHLTRGIPT